MYLNTNLISNAGTSGGPLPLVPRVFSSRIMSGQPDGILITFDRPMILSAHIKNAISIIINGGAPIHPQDVHVNPTNPQQIAIVHHPDFNSGDVITWAYNDQHPTESIVDKDGTELDNQTYGVTNNLDAITGIRVINGNKAIINNGIIVVNN